jgi:hypothetical protein
MLTLLAGVLVVAFAARQSLAQSTSQEFPTPITASDLTGKIKARDVGDARLTSHYYVFDGQQGDIFINLVTINLDGAIDIFTAEGLRPVTTIRVFADGSRNETGRAVYLRKPERLILRVEGRSPNDDPATYEIKFAGSFAAVNKTATDSAPRVPDDAGGAGDVTVNSVGTKIAVKPKPTPLPEDKRDSADSKTTGTTVVENAATKGKSSAAIKKPGTDESGSRNTKKSTDVETKPDAATTRAEGRRGADRRKTTVSSVPKKAITPKPDTTEKTAANPLENIHLVLLMKDGTRLERRMSEILKVNVDKGTLTVITNDGTITRYSILDVARMTIE